MRQWRVTKYNPRLRNRQGHFKGEAWTAVSDIGKVFDGEVLTIERYRAVEDAYVETAMAFFRENG